jgi:hypothetical protein
MNASSSDKNNRRFSANSIETQFSKFNNDTINNMSQMTTPGRVSNSSNQRFEDLEKTPCNPVDLHIGCDDADSLINYSNKFSELASMYFKPCNYVNGQEMTPTVAHYSDEPESEASNKTLLEDEKTIDDKDTQQDFKADSDRYVF